MPRLLSYRLLFALLLWLALGGCSSVDPPNGSEDEDTEPSLRNAAEEIDFYIGAAVGTGLTSSDARYAEVLAREFNMIVAENAMKMGPIRPTRATFDFDDADAIVEFAERNEMAVRGHALVWHNQVPTWVQQGNWSREQLMDILQEHITTVVERYEGRIMAWDVVNEAVADNGELRETIWLDVIGPEYIALAFEWAHEADPNAILFYNDYGAEGLGAKSDAVYELVEGLLDDGVPVGGVGLQMHVSTDYNPPAADVAANIGRLADLGLAVHITEMDVRIPTPASDGELAEQADIYQTMLELCLEAWNCTSFVLWGFTDRYSWIPGTFNGYGAGLIFDSEYNEKIAYDAIERALTSANEATKRAQTSANHASERATRSANLLTTCEEEREPLFGAGAEKHERRRGAGTDEHELTVRCA